MDSSHPNSGAERPSSENEGSFSENYENGQHFEENSSGAYQRSSASAGNGPNSSSSNQPRPPQNNNEHSTQKQSGSYKFTMILQVVFETMEISTVFAFQRMRGGFVEGELFRLLTCICGLVQAIYGVYGAFDQSLKHMERALLLMKIYVCERAFIILVTFPFEGFWNQMIPLGLWILFILLPTIQERNRLKSLSESQRNDGPDPIEKLDSWKYTVYKYWLLIAFCMFIKVTISGESEEVEMPPLTSEIATWVDGGAGMLASLSFIAFLVFAFEGIRRKHLANIVKAVRLIELFIVLLCVHNFCNTYFSVEKSVPKLLKEFPASSRQIGPFFSFLLDAGLDSFMFYLLFMYGAYQVRDILKEHERYRQRL